MTNLDIQFIEFITNLRTPIGNLIFTFLSHIGDNMLIWFIILMLLIYKNKNYYILKYIIPISLAGTFLNNFILKPIIQRPRPFLQSDLIIPLVTETSFSMPSGHSMSSFLAATLLSFYFPKFKVFFYALASLIAFSRIYVGVHFLSDVVIGALVGIVVARIGLIIIKKTLTKS